jgi:hypothetical protein
MLRIAATMLALTVTGALVAGCGKSSPMSSGVAGAPVTEARLVAFAHAVNLRQSDAPGMVASSTEAKVNVAAAEDELARCLGVPTRGRDVTRIYSPTLRATGYEARSDVGADLDPSRNATAFAAQRAHDLAALRSKRGVACNERFLKREYGRRVNVSALSNPLSGTDGNVGLRARVTGVGLKPEATSGGGAHERFRRVTFVLYQDIFLINVGRAGIELEAYGDARPFPLATERRLLMLLYKRAQTHRL